jgi:hypothetical protein
MIKHAILLVFLVSFIFVDGRSQINFPSNKDSWIQTEFGYDQFKNGFLTIGTGFHLHPESWVYSWHSHGVYFGYSPISNIYSIFYNGDITINLLSTGCKIITYTRFSKTNYVFRPFLGLNIFDQFKFNIGYNVFSNNIHQQSLSKWVLSTSIGLKVTNRR